MKVVTLEMKTAELMAELLAVQLVGQKDNLRAVEMVVTMEYWMVEKKVDWRATLKVAMTDN